MKKTILPCLAFLCIFLFSCSKEKTPAELLQKKWIANSQELLGSTIPLTDGSYLKFNSTTTGEDYKGSNKTTGAFTYTLSEAGTSLAIVDADSNGGNYNYTWMVETLTSTDLTISANLGAFGVTRIKLSAE
ncbi:MAG: hypothetical protein NT150_01785 [Bacteroidetes bacterium]|nr:hypothetical protein [Bacteroidota bacterium]